MKKIKSLLLVISLITSFSALASHCPNNLEIFDLEKFQAFISIVDSSDSEISSAKKIANSETVIVEGLNAEIFNEIAINPESIAFILGAELIEKKSENEFKLEIPGILGFDLSFWVKTKVLPNNKVKIDLTDFNTFFYQGSGVVELVDVDGQSAINVNGSAYIPSTAARIFIFGVGGEKNFKKLIQSEIDKQTKLGLERFERLGQ